MIFDYPSSRTTRRHGPAGYLTSEAYRPWLRDEFTFRCVYCLKRETWGQVTGDFELDHFHPQSIAPHLALDYFNLVYACRRCNSVKSDQSVANPLTHLSSERIAVAIDGELVTEDAESQRLILQLDLNSPKLKEWRVMWMRIVALAAEQDLALYSQLTGFPSDLPNVARLRPPNNSRPEGADESWFAKRESGELPDVY